MSDYHCPTGENFNFVDPEVNRKALAFICGCRHLTRKTEEELDDMFAKMTEEELKKQKTENRFVCEPDANVIAAYEETDEDEWMYQQPPASAYEYDE